jgi:DNA repair protein RecO
MAYKAYITEAIVCGSEDHNTSDKSYLLFSRDAGMVWATARSVREERSKQRYALQDFSHARLTLIRGKSGWKIAGAEPIVNVYTRATKRETRAMVMRVVQLLRRVMQGETPHEHIFDDVIETLALGDHYDSDKMERLMFLRVLYALGYIAKEAPYEQLLTDGKAGDVIQLLRDEHKATIEAVIDHALAQSQL